MTSCPECDKCVTDAESYTWMAFHYWTAHMSVNGYHTNLKLCPCCNLLCDKQGWIHEHVQRRGGFWQWYHDYINGIVPTKKE